MNAGKRQAFVSLTASRGSFSLLGESLSLPQGRCLFNETWAFEAKRTKAFNRIN